MSTPALSGKHVLLVARTAASFGGVITYLKEVSTELLANDAKVTVAINVEGIHGLQAAEVDRRVQFVECAMPATADEVGTMLSGLVTTLAPDVIHCNDNSNTFRQGVVEAKAFQRAPTQRLVTLHADVAAFGDDGAKRSLRKRYRTYLKRRQVKRFICSFDKAISVSESIGAKLRTRLSISESTIVDIPNGVDPVRFAPVTRPSEQSSDAVVIGCSGGLFTYKRFDVAIRALSLLKDSRHVRLRIAGDGPLRSELPQLSRSLGVEDRVEFLGVVTDMPGFLRGIDILVCPSDATETSCYAQLEAMAVGLPSVCSRYADLAVRVRDGVEGFLAAPGDVSAFADRLSRLVDDDGLRHRMGTQARSRVVEKYSRSDYLRKTLMVYASMLQRPH